MADAKSTAKKKPGRKTTDPAKQVGPDYSSQTPSDVVNEEAGWRKGEEAEAKHLATIDQRFGDDLPYDKHRIESEAKFYFQQSTVTLMEAGRRMLVIKEHEDHGEFLMSLERIGITPRVAQKTMQATIKFSGAKAPLTALLSKTKLFELISEDDDELEALTDGGTLAGLSLDKIDKMPASELRAALRKARQKASDDAEVNERLLESKDKSINKLEKDSQERTKRVKKWEGAATELSLNITTLGGGIIENITHLRTHIDEVLKEADRLKVSEAELGAVAKIMQDILQNLNEHMSELNGEFDSNLSGCVPLVI